MNDDLLDMDVVAVSMEQPTGDAVVLLREYRGQRVVPIWVASAEALAIDVALREIDVRRPLSMDFAAQLLSLAEPQCEHLEITAVVDGIFLAELVFDNGVRLQCRPSDGIGLCLRVGAPIMAASTVVDLVGIEMTGIGEEDDEDFDPEGAEEEVDAFREFLEGVSAEDLFRELRNAENDPGPEENPRD